MLTTPEIFRSFWPVGSTSMAGLFSTTKKTMSHCATCFYPFFNQWALSPINLDQVPGHSTSRKCRAAGLLDAQGFTTRQNKSLQELLAIAVTVYWPFHVQMFEENS